MKQEQDPDEYIGDVFSNETSSEKTGDEKSEWITREYKGAKKARKAKAKQEEKARIAIQTKTKPFQRSEPVRIKRNHESHPEIQNSKDRNNLHMDLDSCSNKNPKNDLSMSHTHRRLMYFKNPPSRFTGSGGAQETKGRPDYRSPVRQDRLSP